MNPINAIFATLVGDLESNWPIVSLVLFSLLYFYLSQRNLKNDLLNLKENLREFKKDQGKLYENLYKEVRALEDRSYSQLREDRSLDREWLERKRGDEQHE